MSRPNKEVFYKETLGPPFGEKEHWFSVILPDGDGPIFVEHEWSHHNPYNLERAVSGSGTTQMSVEEFLSGEYTSLAKTNSTGLSMPGVQDGLMPKRTKRREAPCRCDWVCD